MKIIEEISFLFLVLGMTSTTTYLHSIKEKPLEIFYKTKYENSIKITLAQFNLIFNPFSPIAIVKYIHQMP